MTKYQLPDSFKDWVSTHLKDTGYKLEKPKDLARAIMKVSDSYQFKDSSTDWTDKATRAAYLAYYYPLNYIRFMRVADQIKSSQFFSGIEQIVDFGCGPGPSTKIIATDNDFNFLKNIHGIDNHGEVRNDYLDVPHSELSISFGFTKPSNDLSSSAIIASYVLNEINELPPWFYQAEALVIIEPSTKLAFKSFNTLRADLIDRSYNLWGPCPHTQTCPLSQSKKDWCHDRVHWIQPPWFQAIENHLPIKNKTLTYSYLLARKTKKEPSESFRIVGDSLLEKGKTRWMLCRNEEREFLSFLHRNGKPPKLYRGDIISLKNSEKKGNELRFTNDDLI